MTARGPITDRLEAEIQAEIRRRGIVVWLDRHAAFTDYVDDLVQRHNAGDFPFPVVAFRGGYLDMILEMAPHADGVDPSPLLIHMPGHTEETIRRTPILEMYRAGFRFRRALESLVREAAAGRVAPDEIESFLRGEPKTLAQAEQWLAEKTAQNREGVAAYLDGLTLEWLLDGLLAEGEQLRERFCDRPALEALADHLYRHTGMDAAFRAFFIGGEALSVSNLRETLAAWLMCVEYVDDLAVPPHLDALKPLRRLSTPLRETCRKLVNHFRDRHPDAYAAQALTAEARLQEEIDAHPPEALGQIDTFNREQERILESAVTSLLDGEWKKTREWTGHRVGKDSFWLTRDPLRRMTWRLLADAAELGVLLAGAERPLAGDVRFDAALEYYTAEGWKIDNAHRRFEQQRAKLLDSQMPHFTRLHEGFHRLRTRYRQWADALAEDFSALCEREGFLPESDLRQRDLYNQVVHPLLDPEQPAALFLLDAFRFEMAAELQNAMEGEDARLVLRGRYAELPTITAVGMNALAPVVRNGRLRLVNGSGFSGFAAGEYTVRRPEDRTRAMGDRSLDNAASGRRQTRGMNLADVCDRSPASLRKSIAGAALLVVHGREIDDAGGANVGPASFEALLRQIRTAWNQLRAAGVRTFVFTADHGFLLRDPAARPVPYGTQKTPNPRYVLAEEARSETGMTHVSLNALGYAGKEGYLLFRRDTAVFETARRGDTFVHGGNSLQERVIPVLTARHGATARGAESRYKIEAQARPALLGFSRIQIRVVDAPSAQLQLGGAADVALALRAQGRSDIQVTIKEAVGVPVENQAFTLRANAAPVEILFDLSGPRDERTRLEIYPLEPGEIDGPFVLPDFFDVSGRTGSDAEGADDSPAASGDWTESFDDPDVRRVFVHLHEHGAITEPELNHLLGAPRKARRFALAFEEHAAKAPFAVRVESTPNGKRYVKE
jgi:hypothetical protein